jgi:alpha-1,6-mannosyltransferase
MTASAQRELLDRRGALEAPWPWVLVGLAGSVLLTLAGSRLGGGSVTWWFDPHLGSHKPSERLVFYVGVALLIAGWLGIGVRRGARQLTTRQMLLIAVLWCVPLALGAPLFSRDIYSYLAQGTIAHLGLSPYHAAPEVLGRLGHAHVLAGVDPFWRKATAPYGPLFLGVISLLVAGTGSHLVAGALLIRAFDLIGLALLAVFVPRLARRTGADPARAVWLAVASPLVLLQLVVPAHNDLLMAGLMVAGVCLALERHALLGIALCALAATVKLPAIIAVAFIAVAWMRTEASWSERARRGLMAGGTAIGVLVLVTLLTGFGTGWISSGLFSTPARVRLAITPATDLSWTTVKLLGDAGLGLSFHTFHAVLRSLMFAAGVITALVLLLRTRWETIVWTLGLSLVAFAVAGPALWPWYLAWGLVLLAAWEPAQRSWLMIGALVLGAILVKPGGILALPLGSSPVIACLWLALAIFLWHRWRRRQRLGARPQPAEGLGPARSVLAER